MTGPAGPLVQTLFDAGTAAGLSDRALVDRFLDRRDFGAESAFASLVERHGPMVLRVCRDVLRDPHDADDAFQAAFLVLARRAESIRSRESIGDWLYGVALRVARSGRRTAVRRREVEREGAAMKTGAHPGAVDRLDAAPALHEEVGRLPDRYRAAVVLCYFEGLTHEEAAGQLGWPVGTVRSRLSWARDRLRGRLTRRGLAPSAALFGASIATSASVPTALAAATVGLAMRATEAGAVPASVAALAGRALRGMAMTKLKMVATGVVAAGLVASAGVGLVSGRQPGGQQGIVEASRTDAAAPDQASRKPANSLPPDPSRELPPATGGSTAAPRVLFVRLKSAVEAVRIKESLGRRTGFEVRADRSEVDALQAQLEVRRDEIQDQLELLKAQLAIREADVATADVQLQRTSLKSAQTDSMAKRNLVGDFALKEARQDVAIRTAERAKTQAEAAEVRVRIAHATRQLKEADGLLMKANDLIAKSSPTAQGPDAPAPPSPPAP